MFLETKVVKEEETMFKTVKNLPLPERYQGSKKVNKYERHLLTMDVSDAVEKLTMNDVQQFYKAARKLGMKVTARVEPIEEHEWGVQRLNTIWRVE